MWVWTRVFISVVGDKYMLVQTNYQDRNKSIYKCDMCDKEIKNKHITRYDKTVYSDELRHSRFIIVDKFDLCPRCEKYLQRMMIKMKEKIKEVK